MKHKYHKKMSKVSKKIKKIADEEPGKPHKAVVGKAYGMMRNKKSKAGSPDYYTNEMMDAGARAMKKRKRRRKK